MAHHWGYSGHLGPDRWADIAPAASGRHQSPIAIDPSDVEFDREMRRRHLQFDYEDRAVRILENNGHSVQVNVIGDRCTLKGGPLDDDEYVLKQFHFHWGGDSSRGSEHVIDGKRYAAELHMVHWNRSKFGDFDEAVQNSNGICVVTVFIEAGSSNDHLEKLTNLFSNIEFAEDRFEIEDGFQPTDLLPGNTRCYWTYCGSLTTPPCHESVRFIIFKDPIEASDEQLEKFRSLHSTRRDLDDRHRLFDNFRPTMELNGRGVKASFRLGAENDSE